MSTGLVLAIGFAFAALGAASERLASVWPADEASRRGPGIRTAALGLLAGGAGSLIAIRSTLPIWVTLVYLALLVPMVVLAATDLEQRLLPHLVLDPLIIGAVVFVPFNPAVPPVAALIGAGAAVAFLGLTGLLVPGGVAAGDQYLVVPIGLVAGWPTVFTAVFAGALLSALAGIGLLVSRRAGLRTYIPFGPFLIAGLVIALAWDPTLLGPHTALLVP
jgi:leader peptidase (prepilin peptidase)/N-methyltransferase